MDMASSSGPCAKPDAKKKQNAAEKAGLTRQSSRFREVVDFLVDEVKLPAADADGYAVRLVGDGYDSVGQLLELSTSVLKADYGFRPGHAMKLDKFKRTVASGSSGGGGGGGALGVSSPRSPATASPRAGASRDSLFEEQLNAMTKVDVDSFAEHLGLDEESILDVAEDKDTEEEAKAFLIGAILDELQVGGALYGQGIGVVKKRAKALGLSAEAIKTASTGAPDKKAAVLRLIFDEVVAQTGIMRTADEGEPVGLTLDDGCTLEISDEQLGTGGGGFVLAATLTRRSGSTENVAVKRLPRGASEKQQQKFVKEFKIALKASQQCGGIGVCQVYDFVRNGTDMCIVMKRYEHSLEDRLQQQDGPLPLPEVLVIMLQIARALAGLHAAEIRVQDLKPGNILLDKEGNPHISDFGIAAIEGATKATTVGGTSNYMCGEMFSKDEPTVQVDVWAFAVMFVELCTGQVPWFGLRNEQIMAAICMDKEKPTIPEDLPADLRALLAACFEHDPVSRPSSAKLGQVLEPMVSAGADELSVLSMHANALLQGSWAKREAYTFNRLLAVANVTDPALAQRYADYKAQLAAEVGGDPDSSEWENQYCQLLFHGCVEEAIPSIASRGFLREYWTTAAGAWQRYGPGFYFALQASKSHEYPPKQMQALLPGTHTRSMLLCKVVKGNVRRTEQNMDTLQGAAPAGYHSVLGIATTDGPLNFDELVVYNEAAILPWLKVTYEFTKAAAADAAVPAEDVQDMVPVGAVLRVDGAGLAQCNGFYKKVDHQLIGGLPLVVDLGVNGSRDSFRKVDDSNVGIVFDTAEGYDGSGGNRDSWGDWCFVDLEWSANPYYDCFYTHGDCLADTPPARGWARGRHAPSAADAGSTPTLTWLRIPAGGVSSPAPTTQLEPEPEPELEPAYRVIVAINPAALGMTLAADLTVSSVIPGSSVDTKGVAKGSKVCSVNNVPVTDLPSFYSAVAKGCASPVQFDLSYPPVATPTTPIASPAPAPAPAPVAAPGMCAYCAAKPVFHAGVPYCGRGCAMAATKAGWVNGVLPTAPAPTTLACPPGMCMMCHSKGGRLWPVRTGHPYCGKGCMGEAKAAGWVPGSTSFVGAVLLGAVQTLQHQQPPMDSFLTELTKSLLQPCTAPGVPPSVPMLVRSSLESVGWDVSRNTLGPGRPMPAAPQVAAMLESARQELASVSLAGGGASQSGGRGGGGGGGSGGYATEATPPGCVAAPMPAVFGAHHGTAGVRFLQSAAAASTASPSEVAELVQTVGGTATATAQSFPDCKLLDSATRSALIWHVDTQRLTQPQQQQQDFRLTVSEAELAACIGAATAQKLFEFFGRTPSVIKLRRVETSSDDLVCVPFHTDYSKRTMQVPLNDPHEYDGGSLVWAVNGALEIPPRPAGSATIHTQDVVHGVTRMTRGTRYGLFLCELPDQQEQQAVDLQYLIAPALDQLQHFFGRAIAILDTTTDEQLRGCAIEYHQLLLDVIRAKGAEGASNQRQATVPSLEVELIWRAHLLSPVDYARDCARLRGGETASRLIDHTPLHADSYVARDPTIGTSTEAPIGMPEAWHSDLVAAVRRQAGFMRQILQLKSNTEALFSTKGLAQELKAYTRYLVEAAGETELAVPSLTLDLVWHTHMLFPSAYASECVQIAGVFINHDDSV